MEIEKLKALEIKDGDILVLEHPGTLRVQDILGLRKRIDEALSVLNVKARLLVLEQGMTIKLIREADVVK